MIANLGRTPRSTRAYWARVRVVTGTRVATASSRAISSAARAVQKAAGWPSIRSTVTSAGSPLPAASRKELRL